MLLKRLALFFPKVGYTQGINFVAGFFLVTGNSENYSLKAIISMLSHR
jgi:hypothetical protein